MSEGKSEERDERDLLRRERVTCPGPQGGLRGSPEHGLRPVASELRFTESRLRACLQPHCSALTARGFPG